MQGSSPSEQDRQLRAQKREARFAAAKRQQILSRVLVGLTCVASFLATLYIVHSTKVLELAPRSAPPVVVVPSKPKTTLIRSVDPDHPIYKYSIVPGGVRSSTEVARAMRLDPVVKEHYAKVNTAALRATTLSDPISAHVSYRVGDKTYWTKKTLNLPAGEKILTDGKTILRERCGNIISMEPLAPALEVEPALPEFDLHADPLKPVDGVPAYLTPNSLRAANGDLPPGVGPGGKGAGGSGSGGSGGSPTGFGLPPGPPVGVPPGLPPGSPTGTPTVNSDPTVTPLATPTPTPTPDVSPDPTPSPTPSPSPSPSPSPTPSPAPPGLFPTPSPDPTPSPTPSPTPGGPGDPRELPLDPPGDIHDQALDPPTPVPEPGTWVLIATGLGIGAARLLKKRSTPSL